MNKMYIAENILIDKVKYMSKFQMIYLKENIA